MVGCYSWCGGHAGVMCKKVSCSLLMCVSHCYSLNHMEHLQQILWSTATFLSGSGTRIVCDLSVAGSNCMATVHPSTVKSSLLNDLIFQCNKHKFGTPSMSEITCMHKKKDCACIHEFFFLTRCTVHLAWLLQRNKCWAVGRTGVGAICDIKA